MYIAGIRLYCIKIHKFLAEQPQVRLREDLRDGGFKNDEMGPHGETVVVDQIAVIGLYCTISS